MARTKWSLGLASFAVCLAGCRFNLAPTPSTSPVNGPQPIPGDFHIVGKPAIAHKKLEVHIVDPRGHVSPVDHSFEVGELVRIDRTDFPGDGRHSTQEPPDPRRPASVARYLDRPAAGQEGECRDEKPRDESTWPLDDAARTSRRAMTGRLAYSPGRAAFLTTLLLVLAACAESVAPPSGLTVLPTIDPAVDDPGEAVGGTETEAARIVERWFQQAGSGAGDLGWSLLYPTMRRDGPFGSAEEYRAAILAADWTRMRYSIGEVSTHDGEYHVTVHVEGGVDAVPAPLLSWGLIQFAPTDGVHGEDGSVTVRIDPSGWPWGILGTG